MEHEPGKQDMPPERPRPEPAVSSREALDFVKTMQEKCKDYDTHSDAGKERVRQYVRQWDAEQRRRIAQRIMIDLVQGRTNSRAVDDAQAPAPDPGKSMP